MLPRVKQCQIMNVLCKVSEAMNIIRARSGLIPKRLIASTLTRFNSTKTSISDAEMSHFNALASSWWDVNGPQRILHKMNLLRMDFIQETVRLHLSLNNPETPLADQIYIPPYGLDLLPTEIRSRIVEEQESKRNEILSNTKWKVLDVGCGGGILSESLARLNYIHSVKGIDLSKDVIEAAKLHRITDPIFASNDTKLTYELKDIGHLPKKATYDIITMFEMLEHVTFPAQVLDEALLRVKIGGWVFVSTINRDFVSWFTTIFMGEHVLKIVPVGTHTLDKYIDEAEIRAWIENDPHKSAKYNVVSTKGCIYLPACGWKFTDNPNVGNYFMAIQRKK